MGRSPQHFPRAAEVQRFGNTAGPARACSAPQAAESTHTLPSHSLTGTLDGHHCFCEGVGDSSSGVPGDPKYFTALSLPSVPENGMKDLIKGRLT